MPLHLIANSYKLKTMEFLTSRLRKIMKQNLFLFICCAVLASDCGIKCASDDKVTMIHECNTSLPRPNSTPIQDWLIDEIEKRLPEDSSQQFVAELTTGSHQLSSNALTAVAIMPDNTTLLIGDCKGYVSAYNLGTMQQLWSTSVQWSAINCIAVSADGKFFATASDDKTVWIWDAASNRYLRNIRHEAAVKSIAISPDGTLLATVGADNARIWELPKTLINQEIILLKSIEDKFDTVQISGSKICFKKMNERAWHEHTIDTTTLECIGNACGVSLTTPYTMHSCTGQSAFNAHNAASITHKNETYPITQLNLAKLNKLHDQLTAHPHSLAITDNGRCVIILGNDGCATKIQIPMAHQATIDCLNELQTATPEQEELIRTIFSRIKDNYKNLPCNITGNSAEHRAWLSLPPMIQEILMPFITVGEGQRRYTEHNVTMLAAQSLFTASARNYAKASAEYSLQLKRQAHRSCKTITSQMGRLFRPAAVAAILGSIASCASKFMSKAGHHVPYIAPISAAIGWTGLATAAGCILLPKPIAYATSWISLRRSRQALRNQKKGMLSYFADFKGTVDTPDRHILTSCLDELTSDQSLSPVKSLLQELRVQA